MKKLPDQETANLLKAIDELKNPFVQPNPEPNCYGDGNVYRGVRSKDSETKTIYLESQKKEWVGLTQKEISEITFLCQNENNSFFAYAVEDKLREKNA